MEILGTAFAVIGIISLIVLVVLHTSFYSLKV